MIVFFIILGYILNIFINRYLNKVVISKIWYAQKVPGLWFVPIFTSLALIYIIINESKFFKRFMNWFTGKHWK